MNPCTRIALEWLVSQPAFLLQRDSWGTTVGAQGMEFTDPNWEDALLAAYEHFNPKPASEPLHIDEP